MAAVLDSGGIHLPPRTSVLGLAVLVLSLATIPVLASHAAADPEERLWDSATLTEVATWRDPGGEGSGLRFDISLDGQRLVMVGYGSPDEIRVVDRDVEPLAVLEPPGPNATVKGVRWSFSDTWVVAWGRAEGEDHDFLAAWNATTYEPYHGLFENDTAPLATVDAVILMSYEEILAIGGRDASGTSRLLLYEIATMRLHLDIPWRDNVTIQSLEWDGIALACVEAAGSVTEVKGSAWGTTRVLDGRPVVPSASSFPRGGQYPWIVGYEDGWMVLWSGDPKEQEMSVHAGEGPIDGLSWVKNKLERYFLAALRDNDGGSIIGTYIFSRQSGLISDVSNHARTSSSVTMMSKDPSDPNQVFAGLEDGTLVLYNITFNPNLPPTVTIDLPGVDQEFNESFIAHGTYTDDRDDVKGVQVSFGDDIWHNVKMKDGTWSYEVNITTLVPGWIEITVKASDALLDNTTSRRFFANHTVAPDEGGDEASILDHPVTYAVVTAAIVLLAWLLVRRSKRRQEQEGEDTDGQERM